MCDHFEAMYPVTAAVMERMEEEEAAAQAPAEVLPLIPKRLDRPTTITMLRAALKKATGKHWTVKGGTGTAWGWIRIHSNPADRTEHGYLTEKDMELLKGVFGSSVMLQGVSIPASDAFYRYYLAKAMGIDPGARPEPYWD